MEEDKVKIKYMKEALKEAKKAYEKDEIPVGAVIVKDGKIIARAHNMKEEKNDTTKHAEIIAIQKASKKINSWRLNNCEMYVTLEPCTMCAAAISFARIEKLYFGRNTTTGISVSQARGVLLLRLAQADMPIGEYTPPQIKRALSGYGGAEKQQMQYMVQNFLKLPEIPKPDDAADALAIAICHAHSRSGL